MSAPFAVELRQVGLRHAGGLQALDQVSLQIAQGEFLCLVGPSGCGKSSLLKLISGLWQPSSGQVSVAGQDPRQAGARQQLSFVFQDPTLMPWASVADNVGLPLKLAGVPAHERSERVAAAVHLVGLEAFAQALPHELSGGMQMRVSIARGLITQPAILLLDEPFGALDEITRHKLDDELLSIWAQGGLTVVFVTHSLAEAAYLGTRACVMGSRPGRIVFEDSAQQPWPRPEHHRTSVDFNQRLRALQSALAEVSVKDPVASVNAASPRQGKLRNGR
ncbi:ABC transporter ATP-binding protein [Aquabacterium parvum]|uniref:ABC transporter ATP-binding protein n=1 Tax=Aquabacterium parvum TaxID=70584 RepID=UPI000718E2D2|nr:ABC transporter ATP-binding protein [Aquabacterium parvum]MBU0918299.1 ABC transporter ATP-binding protein [Gammaproteobacteria bacterium]